MANMAWGVERVVESATEQALNRFEQERLTAPPPPEPRTDNKLLYRLATEVPNNWIPLLPVRTTEGLRLQRGKVRKVSGDSEFTAAQGRILNPDNRRGLKIFEDSARGCPRHAPLPGDTLAGWLNTPLDRPSQEDRHR
jgi:hypothetical protein